MDDYGSSRSLTPFIDTATVIVDRVKTAAAAKGIALLATELELIERWLAAHFYAQSDKPYAEKETGNAKAKFVGRTGMYLESTLYGQTAARVDPSGVLAALATSARAVGRGHWLGRRPSEQTNYNDRR